MQEGLTPQFHDSANPALLAGERPANVKQETTSAALVLMCVFLAFTTALLIFASYKVLQYHSKMKKHYSVYPKITVEESLFNTLKTSVSCHGLYYKMTNGKKYVPPSNYSAAEEGTAGAFVIPGLKYSVPLYYTKEETAQEICDKENSAVMLLWEYAPIIADHESQGFSVIKKLKPGQICYIQKGKDLAPYLCIKIDQNGVNLDGIILSSDGTILFDLPRDMLVLYTCNDISESITNVLLVRIVEAKDANIVLSDSLEESSLLC